MGKTLKVNPYKYLSVFQRFYHDSPGHMESRSKGVTDVEGIDIILYFWSFIGSTFHTPIKI